MDAVKTERYFHEIPDERFKEWARARHGLPIRPSDGDKQELILGEWAAWQAALAQPAQPVVDALDKAVKAIYAMTDALRPPPAGSFARGEHEGICAAARTVADMRDKARAAPQPAPVADAFEQECADVDAILGELGLDPERMRTESGRLILSRIFEAIRAGRATVAEDATRLDWLERNISEDELRRLFPGETDDLRAAIDARGKL